MNKIRDIALGIIVICDIIIYICIFNMPKATETKHEIIDNPVIIRDYVTVVVDSKPFETKEIKTTFYDSLTDEEINMLEVVVQHEVGNSSKDYKTLVAELIYNRIMSDEFPNTVYGVLYQENQFCGIDYWYYPAYPVDDETKRVVREVFSKEFTSHPATYYYNPELSEYSSMIWFEYSGDVQYLFQYAETSWGTTYNTRFFS